MENIAANRILFFFLAGLQTTAEASGACTN